MESGENTRWKLHKYQLRIQVSNTNSTSTPRFRCFHSCFVKHLTINILLCFSVYLITISGCSNRTLGCWCVIVGILIMIVFCVLVGLMRIQHDKESLTTEATPHQSWEHGARLRYRYCEFLKSMWYFNRSYEPIYNIFIFNKTYLGNSVLLSILQYDVQHLVIVFATCDSCGNWNSIHLSCKLNK